MKTLVAAILLAIAALNAKAIPILSLEVSQQNWNLDLVFSVTDSTTGNPLLADMFFNGQTAGFASGYFWEGLLPESGLPPQKLNFGLNQFSVIYQGQTYFSETFVITQPTGVRPAVGVPDAGASVVLALLSLSALIGVRHWKRTPAPI
jgi:hypothetical protein